MRKDRTYSISQQNINSATRNSPTTENQRKKSTMRNQRASVWNAGNSPTTSNSYLNRQSTVTTKEEPEKRASVLKSIFSLNNGNNRPNITRESLKLPNYQTLGRNSGSDTGLHEMEVSKYSLLITGPSGVGKTALTIRFLTGRFISEYIPGQEMEFKNEINLSGSRIELKIIDSNKDNFTRSIDQIDACLMVYALNDDESAKTVIKMVDALKERISRKGDPVLIVVLGNKCDYKHGKVVVENDVKTELDTRGVQHFIVSAASHTNVVEVLNQIINVVEIRKMRQPKKQSKKGISGFKKMISGTLRK